MHGRVDDIQKEIVAALTKIGAVVTDLSQAGKGVPDLLISYRNTWFLMECIGAAKFKKYKKTEGLNPRQVEYHANQRAPILVARSDEEAIGALINWWQTVQSSTGSVSS